MATHELSGLHLGAMSDPTNTTDPAIWQPFSILATNDVWKHGVWVFGSNNAAQPSVKITIYFSFKVPLDFSSATTDPTIRVYWTSTLTSGNRVWDLEYRAVDDADDTESLDQTSNTEALTLTDAAPTAANRMLIASFTLARAGIEAGDELECALSVDGVDAADTLAGSGILQNVGFRYSDA